MKTPLILYVPGLLPKPEAGVHREALRRCLAAALERHDDEVARAFAAADHSFDVVAWTFDFYREHRDFALDARSVDRLLEQAEASEQDIVEASSTGKRLLRWLYRVGNLFRRHPQPRETRIRHLEVVDTVLEFRELGRDLMRHV